MDTGIREMYVRGQHLYFKLDSLMQTERGENYFLAAYLNLDSEPFYGIYFSFSTKPKEQTRLQEILEEAYYMTNLLDQVFIPAVLESYDSPTAIDRDTFTKAFVARGIQLEKTYKIGSLEIMPNKIVVTDRRDAGVNLV